MQARPTSEAKPMTKPSRIPAGIWVLGFVSMLMDISSEMIHSLLPLFMVGALGASAFAVGLIEGLAEATALIVGGFCQAVLEELPMEFAVEAQKLLGVSLEGSVG